MRTVPQLCGRSVDKSSFNCFPYSHSYFHLTRSSIITDVRAKAVRYEDLQNNKIAIASHIIRI